MSAFHYQYMISKEGCSNVVPVPSLLYSSFLSHFKTFNNNNNNNNIYILISMS